MRIRLPLAVALIVAALSLSACGGSGSDGSTSSDGGGASSTEAPSSGGSGGAGGSGSEVKIADFAFDPTELDVKVGDTVTFTNSDDAQHTATAKEGDPKMFDTKKLSKGDSKGITFDEAGDYEYFCSIHEYMKGTVHVMK